MQRYGGNAPAVLVIGRCSLIQHFIKKGAFPGFGVQVLLVQKSLKKLKGAHRFE